MDCSDVHTMFPIPYTGSFIYTIYAYYTGVPNNQIIYVWIGRLGSIMFLLCTHIREYFLYVFLEENNLLCDE